MEIRVVPQSVLDKAHLLPMFLAMIAVLLMVTYIPKLSLWLPELFGF